MNKIINIMGIIVLLGIISFAGYNLFVKDEFVESSNDLSSKNHYEQETTPIILPEDYETEEIQVRHLSWGKLNYYPETITVKAGKKVQLVGDISRLRGCFNSFTIPDLDVTGSFEEKDNTIEFTPLVPGEFGFGCVMGMGSGKLIVQ